MEASIPAIPREYLLQFQNTWKRCFGGELYTISQQPEDHVDVYVRIELRHKADFWLIGSLLDEAQRPMAEAMLESWAVLLRTNIHDKETSRGLSEELLTAWDHLSFLHKAARLMRTNANLIHMSKELLQLAVQTIGLDNAFIAITDKLQGDITFHWTVPGRYSAPVENNIIRGLQVKETFLQCENPRECYETIRTRDIASFIGKRLDNVSEDVIYLGLLSHTRPHTFNAGEIQIYESLTEQVTTIVEVNALHKKQMEIESLNHDLEIAAEVQDSFLPATLPSLEKLEFAPKLIPAAKVGGDFYDVYDVGDHYGLLVCDVVGKGISAALLASEIRTAVRAQMRYKEDPGKILQEVNRVLYDDLAKLERFATVMLLYMSENGDEWRYANAGHTSGVHLRAADASIALMESTNFPIGIFEEMSDEQDHITMHPGDVVVLYSDGLSEVEDADGNILGIEGVVETLLATYQADADFISERLFAAQGQHRWTHAVEDDLTIIVIKKKDTQAAQKARQFFHWRVTSNLSRLAAVNKELSRLQEYLPATDTMMEWYFELDLAVSELVTNVMRHSYKDGQIGYINGVLALYDEYVTFDLYDNGVEFEGSLEVGELDYEDDLPPDGGYGLYIMTQVMDDVSYTRRSDGYNHWHFKRKLPPLNA